MIFPILIFLLCHLGSTSDLPTLEQINRALEQPENDRLVQPAAEEPIAEQAVDWKSPQLTPSPTAKLDHDGVDLVSLVKGKIEGAPELTSYVKRKPVKNTTIWTTVTPPTACSASDGCCPENVVTSVVTATITSEDLFVYTVTETIDVTVFRGHTEVTTSLQTTTQSLILTSTVRREGTVITTSFLTTFFPITRFYLKTSRAVTPAIRTVFVNTSTTSTRTSTVVSTINETRFQSGTVTSTEINYLTTKFETAFITFTQTVFNPLTIVQVTVFKISTTTQTLSLPFVTDTTSYFATVIVTPTDIVTYTTTITAPTLQFDTLLFTTTTGFNYLVTQSIISTITWSRLY